MSKRPLSPRNPSILLTAVIGLLLSACGGGGGDSSNDGTTEAPEFTSASVDRLSYRQLSTFTVTGSHLTNGASFSATGCSNLTTLAGSGATQQVLTCTPDSSLTVRVAASVNGSEVFSRSFSVPKPQVTLTTTLGNVVVELEPTVVQATVDNFLGYVSSGFYDGTLFHRVMPNFVVQGGGFTTVAGNALTGNTPTQPALALQVGLGLSNVRGSIAMARTNVLDSATSQFFFNTVNNAALDTAGGGYAVFGTVVSGLDVIDAISVVQTRSVGGFDNVPVTDVVVQTARQTL